MAGGLERRDRHFSAEVRVVTATDLDALFAAALESPADAGLKLILADALADAGDPVTERAVRWCVANGKWPNFTHNGVSSGEAGHWGWYGQTARNLPDARSDGNLGSRLPFDLWSWFLVRGKPEPGFLEFVRKSGGTDDFAEAIYEWSGPFPHCRDDDIRIVLARLGQALEWAGPVDPRQPNV